MEEKETGRGTQYTAGVVIGNGGGHATAFLTIHSGGLLRMGKNHRLGYDAERAVEVMWNELERPVMRPRAGAQRDVGDLVGMPLVQSVKNWNHLALAEWVGDLQDQMVNAGLPMGVVWHKRRGKAHPYDWYVTTSGVLAVALIDAYCDQVASK